MVNIESGQLLLNVCCAPCALPIVKTEKPTLLFYNPNIYPRAEYNKRLVEVRKVADIFGLNLEEGEYDHQEWLDYLKSNLPEPPESYPENSLRCRLCFKYRLLRTAKAAKEKRLLAFGTTLSNNRYKETDHINKLGEEIASNYQLNYIKFDLDKEKAYQIGRTLSREYNIYRQKYCGCEFSL
ncbi:MAG: epoxyqueuosine reductase QueH [bacterium]